MKIWGPFEGCGLGFSSSPSSVHSAFCQNYHLIVPISSRLSSSEVGLGCDCLSDVPPSTFGGQQFCLTTSVIFQLSDRNNFFSFHFQFVTLFLVVKMGGDNFQAPSVISWS